jgi:hypothetical protein
MMNDIVVHQAIDALSILLVSTLKSVFDTGDIDREPVYQALPNVTRDLLLTVMQQARRISYMIQHSFSRKMEVIQGVEDKVTAFGMYAFGLRRHSGAYSRIVLGAKTFTLQSFLD